MSIHQWVNLIWSSSKTGETWTPYPYQSHVLLQIVIKKLVLWPLKGRHKLNSLGFPPLPKKCVKSMTILRLDFTKRIIYRKWYWLIFYTKMTIFPCKVRHVSPSRDIWICLAANYLHIDIFDKKLKKVWMVCVMCHVLVKFSPLFGDHRLQRAERGSRRFRCPRQWSHWWETEQQTRGLNQDWYVSKKSANVQANAIRPKIRFFLLV